MKTSPFKVLYTLYQTFKCFYKFFDILSTSENLDNKLKIHIDYILS